MSRQYQKCAKADLLDAGAGLRRLCHGILGIFKVRNRGDISHLPDPLKDRLVQMAGRPHSQLPTQAYAEAREDDPPFKLKPIELFQYYLLDTTGFEPNPFTSLIRGVNDTAMLTATGPSVACLPSVPCGLF